MDVSRGLCLLGCGGGRFWGWVLKGGEGGVVLDGEGVELGVMVGV